MCKLVVLCNVLLLKLTSHGTWLAAPTVQSWNKSIGTVQSWTKSIGTCCPPASPTLPASAFALLHVEQPLPRLHSSNFYRLLI